MRLRNSLIAELQDAIESGSKEKRVDTLRRVTDLFLCDAERFNESQIEVFDDVLCHLIKRIENKALAVLSTRLAPVGNSPIEVIRRLARNDDIVVAAPVLTQSARLTADDLIEIAQTKSQAHLLAISGRAQLEESVTDQLLIRGDREVAKTLSSNVGARFSESGFTNLVNRAEADDGLAKRIGLRLDLPLRLLRELLLRATEAVRSWLIANAPAEAQDEIQRVIAAISNEVRLEAITPRDFTDAQQLILSIKKRGELNEMVLLEFANKQKYEETVAALAELSSASLQTIAVVMRSNRNDGVLIPCKAAGLQWLTVSSILKSRIAHHCIPDHDLDQVEADYRILSRKNAQRTLRFWQTRESVTTDNLI
jgi:uncharacterized protein (DUF2336 family)